MQNYDDLEQYDILSDEELTNTCLYLQNMKNNYLAEINLYVSKKKEIIEQLKINIQANLFDQYTNYVELTSILVKKINLIDDKRKYIIELIDRRRKTTIGDDYPNPYKKRRISGDID